MPMNPDPQNVPLNTPDTAGYEGEYPGTYAHVKKMSYNRLDMALMGNDSAALDASHDRVPKETITPIASRGITGPLAEPVGQRTPWPTDDSMARDGLHGDKNTINY
jgi:hypothetical protein